MSLQLTGAGDVPVVIVASTADHAKQAPSPAPSSFNLVGSVVGDVPSLIFDTQEDRDKVKATSVEEFARSKALTPADGLARGVAAFSNQLVQGITGVVTEPIRGATEKGVEGFFSGIGKGLLGVVFKPIGGVLELGGKVGEGFVNTPQTLANLVVPNTNDLRVFGVPVLESFEQCKAQGRKHIFVRIMEFMSDPTKMKAAEGLFVYAPPLKTVREIANAYDQGLDPDLNTLDPLVVAGLLVRWLERLPEPIVPPEFHPHLGALLVGPTADLAPTSPSIKKLHLLLNQLQPANRSVLFQLCLAIRRFLYFSNSGSIALDHISLLLGRLILRSGPPNITPDPIDDAPSTPDNTQPLIAKKPDFATPELKAYTLAITRPLLRFYCPGYLTYQLHTAAISLEL